MNRKTLALLVTMLVILLARPATGEPLPTTLRFRSESHVVTKGGTERDLPPGYFLPDPVFAALDVEMKRLQDAETRLDAENKSFRASAAEGPGWGTLSLIAGALAAGFAAGAMLR